jgi:hypothetical protein
MPLLRLLSNSTPVPMHPAGPVTSPTRQNTTYDSQIRSGDITLLDTPGLPAPQPAALYHMGSDLLVIILQNLHSFATLWNIRRVCLEFFRLVMGDTKSNELCLNTLRRSKVPIEFLPTLGKGIRFHCDSGPMMMLMVHNYNRSLWSLFRMMHYNMLMNLCLYDEDVVFFTEDNAHQLRQHPYTFPVLSLQSIMPKLGVTMDLYMTSILERKQNETDADLPLLGSQREQSKKEIIVRAIIRSDSWNTFESVTGVFSGQWSHNLSHVLAEYQDRLDEWLDEPNNQILASRMISHQDGRHVIRTHPTSNSATKTLYADLHYNFNAIIEGEYVFPLFDFNVQNRHGCIDSLLQFRSESEKCLLRIGYLQHSEDDLDAGIQSFFASMVPDTEEEALEIAIKNKTAPGLLNLYVPRQWTNSLCYKKRSTLFPILRATHSSSPFGGSELLFMLKKLYDIQDERDIWAQFINSKRGAYAPATAITFIDDSRPGHRDKRMKKRSRGIFDDARMSSSSQLKQRT